MAETHRKFAQDFRNGAGRWTPTHVSAASAPSSA
jgi:hypothetical protein